MIIDPNTYSTIYLGASQLWQGANNGNNWNAIKTDASLNRRISAIDIAQGNSNIIWVGYSNGDVAYTDDGGTTWNAVDGNGIGLPNRFVTDISIHPGDHDNVMITLGGYNQENIYFTTNEGSSWFNRSLDFPMQVNTVRWHPVAPEWVYVGTDYGIMASENFGSDWSVRPFIGNNEGPVFTRIEELVWQGDGSANTPYFLCAFTHGRGVWRSNFPILKDMYVDRNYSGVEYGTFQRPFNTLQAALNAAGEGTKINFKSNGVHNETGSVIIDKKSEIIATNGAVIIN